MFKNIKMNRLFCLVMIGILSVGFASCSHQTDYSDYNRILAQYSDNETVYYSFEDLDGNGIKELMIDKGKTVDLFTLDRSNKSLLIQKDLTGSVFYTVSGNRFAAHADYGTGFSGVIIYEYDAENRNVRITDEYSVLAPVVVAETYYHNSEPISTEEYFNAIKFFCRKGNRVMEYEQSPGEGGAF